MMGRRPTFWRDEILMLIGAGLFGLGALALLGFALDFDLNEKGVVGGLILTGMMLVGGGVVFRVGLGFRRLEKRLVRILELVSTVDRISLRDVARGAGVSEEEARTGVIFLINRGYVSLRYDPATGQVHSPRAGGAGGWLKLPGVCPNCSAPCPSMVQREAEPPRCEYCGANLPVQALAPRKEAEPWQDPAAARREAAPGLNSSAFSGSWGLLIFLFIFFWPVGVIYLIQGLKKHGGGQVFRA